MSSSNFHPGLPALEHFLIEIILEKHKEQMEANHRLQNQRIEQSTWANQDKLIAERELNRQYRLADEWVRGEEAAYAKKEAEHREIMEKMRQPAFAERLVEDGKRSMAEKDQRDREFAERERKRGTDSLQESRRRFDESQGDQRAEPRKDPLILDLDGDGIETTDLCHDAFFDHDKDGLAESTSWVSKDDGLLVMDRNGDGMINDSGELFGDQTILETGVLASNGFEALAELDTNGDGKIDGRAKTSGGDFEVRRIIRQVLRDHGGRLFEWWHDVFRGINKAPD